MHRVPLLLLLTNEQPTMPTFEVVAVHCFDFWRKIATLQFAIPIDEICVFLCLYLRVIKVQMQSAVLLLLRFILLSFFAEKMGDGVRFTRLVVSLLPGRAVPWLATCGPVAWAFCSRARRFPPCSSLAGWAWFRYRGNAV